VISYHPADINSVDLLSPLFFPSEFRQALSYQWMLLRTWPGDFEANERLQGGQTTKSMRSVYLPKVNPHTLAAVEGRDPCIPLVLNSVGLWVFCAAKKPVRFCEMVASR